MSSARSSGSASMSPSVMRSAASLARAAVGAGDAAAMMQPAVDLLGQTHAHLRHARGDVRLE